MSATASSSFWEPDTRTKRCALALTAVAIGVLVAGFWNYEVVDGVGENVIAPSLVGAPGQAATTYGTNGALFGLLFGVAAGLAASFTACNCVVYAMIPGLVTESEGGIDRSGLLKTLGAFVAGVLFVGVGYGAFVGMLGPDGVEAINSRPVRLAQAQTVFTLLGIGLLAWGAVEMGFLDGVKERLDEETRSVLARPSTRAGVMGLFVGSFTVGRPYPVFRDLLTYAANANSPLYGVAVVFLNDLGMIAIMIVTLLVVVRVFGDRIAGWVRSNPRAPQTVSGFAFLTGGAYFVFYWGLALTYDVGMWGFKLGLYHH